MTFLRPARSFFLFLLLVLVLIAPVRAADAPVPLQDKDIFDYLDQSTTWYRNVTASDMTTVHAREITLNITLQQNALRSLRYSFDFARVLAAQLEAAREWQRKEAEKIAAAKTKQELSENKPAADSKDGEADLNRAKLTVDDKLAQIQAELANAKRAARRGGSKAQRAIWQARQDKLNAELALTNARKELISTITTGNDESDETLMAQIDNLAAAIPELDKDRKKKTAAAAATDDKTNPAQALTSLVTMQLPVAVASDPAKTDEVVTAASKGIIGLSSDIIALLHQKQILASMHDQTKNMTDSNTMLLARLRNELLYIVQRGNALGAQQNNDITLDRERQELLGLTARFQQLSQIIVPLNDQKRSLENCLKSVQEWQGLFGSDMNQLISRLFWRLFGLAIAILIPLILSEIARRAILKYVHDSRRLRQLHIMRRVIMFIIIGIVIILNLITEMGSLATFVGFVTAGLAVALQNVILSAVAYFFFFGRYGIRVGSRVSVYGTTGEVIETGLVRLYLMELNEEADGKWQATGRIVAFPNSILFQPTAFFKQVPGAKFQQHEIAFPLAVDIDRTVVEKKLKEAAKAIYDDSHAILEVQRIALEQTTHIQTKIPRPKGSLRETSGQLAFVMRYPVAADRADNIDQNVARIISDILERDPKTTRLNNDAPKITKVLS